jgi:hypothetical protein
MSGPREDHRVRGGRLVVEHGLVDGGGGARRRRVGLDGFEIGVLEVDRRDGVEVGVEGVVVGIDQDHPEAARP